jgi:subtilisin
LFGVGVNTKKTAYFLVFLLVLGTSSFAHGATEDTRYWVDSQSGFWKKYFGVRHELNGGFTTDLTDLQLRVAKVFGVEVLAVNKLFISQETVTIETADIVVDNTDELGEDAPVVDARPIPSDQIPWGIEAVYGNNPTLVKTSGGEDVSVAVLDTGVFVEHFDLKDRISQCKDFTGVKPSVVDGRCEDKNGHGTHVAGTIAADGGSDGKGIYGVAPEANLYAYKVCGANGSCWADDVAIAIRTAVDKDADIINISLGGDSDSSLIKNALLYAVDNGVLVFVAAGNDGPEFGSIGYPGANTEVIAVGAFDVDYSVAEWSSRGINSETTPDVIEEGDIEFSAPGVNIESTSKDGGYIILSGTSMATPHLSGLAAKLWQKDVEDVDSATATRELLHKFSENLLPPGDDDASGFGFPHL